MIPITKPFLPPYEDYESILKGIWKRNWLTNNGPILNAYELELKKHLGLDHALVVGNGTIALQLAFRALKLKGKVITTPFSYVATTSSLVWEQLEPTFVDIDAQTFNLNPELIEASIDDQTTAILATHCFGNSCDIDGIDRIAKKHNLKVIYDASHCFGTLFKGKSVFDYGDISTLSLHATKPIHMVEGGAIFSQNPELIKEMAFMRNFGHNGEEEFYGLGINAKNSEFHAAMGMATLKHTKEILTSRKNQYHYYQKMLENEDVQLQKTQTDCTPNYSYFPVVFATEKVAKHVLFSLKENGVIARRYFYPSLNELPYVGNQPAPVAMDVAKRILCLPLYFSLEEDEQRMIVRLIKRALRY